MPPITIHITNNNNGNNSNTNDNTQTNQQDNTQTNQQDNTQTNQQDVEQVVTDEAPPLGVTVPPSLPLPPLPTMFERDQLSRRARPTTARWISLAATGDLHGRPGVRASIDLLGRRGFTLGVAGVLDGGGGDHRDERGGGHDSGAAAIGYLAWTGRLGKLDLRAQVGVGAALGDAESKVTAIARTTGSAAERDGDPRVTPRAEAALLVGLPLGRHLGVIAGPVISTSKLEVDHRGAVETTMTGGLRYRF